jgi:hypothetical protein
VKAQIAPNLSRILSLIAKDLHPEDLVVFDAANKELRALLSIVRELQAVERLNRSDRNWLDTKMSGALDRLYKVSKKGGQ